MRVNLPIKEGFFNINSVVFCGVDSYLITPQIDAKWNQSNLFFRSLITDREGNILSSGFPKFFNYGEKLDCYPDPENFNDWRYEDKIDGSLLIADYVNDTFSMRTRGTVSYASQENARDFERLPDKYPKVVDFLKENQHLSLLFEIVTPNNVIVVRPQQIEFYLIGAINKNGMVVVSPNDLTDIWRKIGPVPAPQSYKFLNTNNLSKIAETIKHWKGKEGIVVSYNNGQNRIKLKSDWYNWLHRIKSKLSSENNLIEYYADSEMPSFEEFFNKIEKEFDFEIATQLEHEILKICKAGEKAKACIENMVDFVASIRSFNSRKDQARHIISSYGKYGRAPFVFSILDGKQLEKNQLIKLINQFL
jgi:hypothetical protein